jgi:hypothetical protein
MSTTEMNVDIFGILQEMPETELLAQVDQWNANNKPP